MISTKHKNLEFVESHLYDVYNILRDKNANEFPKVENFIIAIEHNQALSKLSDKDVRLLKVTKKLSHLIQKPVFMRNLQTLIKT